MKSRLSLALLSFCLAAAAPRAAQTQTQTQVQVQIIANPSVADTSVSKGELRDVFTGSVSALKNGTRVVPVLLREGVIHQDFLNLYIDRSDSAFRANWRSLVFSGEAVMPRSFDSEAGVVEFVSHTPGAIGYISRTTPHAGVKTLSVR